MVELLYASGLRISELANARLENLNAEERILRVTGKGNKTRLVPVGRKACEALASLSLDRTTETGEAAHGQRNFPFGAGNETNDDAHLADREEARADIPALETNIYPHLLRHSFATHLARQRRRFADHPGNARARGYLDDPGLHACGSATIEGRASEISSARLMRRSQSRRRNPRRQSDRGSDFNADSA